MDWQTVIWGTADLVEVLWTLSALPGLVMWLVNLAAANRSRKAMVVLGYGNGRLLWARFGVLLTSVFSTVELVFVLIGVVAMLRSRPANMGGDWTRPVLTVGLIGASALIAFVGWRWRVVDHELVERYRQRRLDGTTREQP